MEPRSDDYGLSDSDETELLNIESNALKRKCNGDVPDVVKRGRIEPSKQGLLTVAQAILKSNCSLDAFRLKQEAAILHLLSGQSSVVVFPTGGGKSLCYQLPALCFKELDRQSGICDPAESGISLVVSPLVSLIKDQVDALKRRGIRAAVLDSTKTNDEYLETVASMRDGTLDILYCAPERLNNERFVGAMAHVRGGVRLLAVDEAHCISEWGHAFRPDYLKVARFAKEIQAERVVCLTATATQQVATDVCRAFGIPEGEGLFRTTSYRNNLHLLAKSYKTKDQSYPELCAFLRAHSGPTIIYVTLQRHTEALALKLQREGFRTRHYHAGMNNDEKRVSQEEFMASDDLVMVATIAFGMGIDKSNIRNVIHYDIPRSLEGYSQEIGRAGRDGLESYCMMYLCAEDLHIRESFARGDLPSRKSVSDLLNDVFSSSVVQSSTGPVIEANIASQSKDFDINPTVLHNIYAQLELRFELLRATTPKYTSYAYKSVTSARFNDTSAAAVAIRATEQTKITLTHVDVDKAARLGSTTRGEIITKLNDWHDNGEIVLKSTGVVNIYRVLKTMPKTTLEKDDITDLLYKELVYREQQELQRMTQVMGLVTGTACFARSLASHFGDRLPDGRQGCGHCTWCETKQAVKKVTPPKVPWNTAAFLKVLKACSDRDDARFLARIAFGIRSPRITAAKLSNNSVFGSMEDHDFMALLHAFEKICEKAASPN